MAKTKTSPAIGFWHMLAAIIALSIIEPSLAAVGIIPPVLSYSPANIAFAVARLAILAYAGMVYAGKGVKEAALRGGALFIVSSLTLCICAFALARLAQRPILGMFMPDGALPGLFAVIVVENTLVGAAISAAVALLAQKKLFRK